MKIKAKRAIMNLLLLAGVLWNLLCLFQLLPLSRFYVSVAAVGGYAVVVIFLPLLFPTFAKRDEKSRHWSALTPQEKQTMGIMLVLAFAWFITLMACIVYPL